MADIRTFFRSYTGEWELSGPSLAEDDGLETAVVISLFTDRVTEADAALASELYVRRGWWGDAYAEVPGDAIGSRLWLLSRSKQTNTVLRQAEQYAAEALQWLVDDGVARSVEVAAEVVRDGVLGLAVSIVRSGQPVQRFRFEAFWKGA